MLKCSLFLYIGMLVFWMLLLIVSCDDNKRLWGKINFPNVEGALVLYQKSRTMHRFPEIILYFQKKNQLVAKPIGNILLPEDDRIKLTYQYEFLNNKEIKLTLSCQHCMIEKRYFEIKLGDTPTLAEIL